MLTRFDIIRSRLSHLLLDGDHSGRPQDIVEQLVAIQAQDYYASIWSIGLRMADPASFDEIENAFNSGEILRTHLLRPTWHFVSPKDIHWLLALTGPRVQASNAFMYRREGIDPGLIRKSNDLIASVLAGNHFLTREEIRDVLQRSGISLPAGQRLTYLVMAAELDGIICSGPRQGRQFTYALLDERAPNDRNMDREEALFELSGRYFTSRGPATIQDFSKWSGLSIADCRKGLEAVKSNLEHTSFNGLDFWFPRNETALPIDPPGARLLSIYDEYISSYKEHAFIGTEEVGETLKALGNDLTSILLIDGQIAGTWKRDMGKDSVTIRISLLKDLDDAQRSMVNEEALKYGKFFGKAVQLSFDRS